MKHFTSMLWAAVAVFGLYSPVFTYAAGPFSKGGSGAGMSRGGQNGRSSLQFNKGSSMKSLPASGGFRGNVMKSQVLRSGGFSSQIINKNPVGRFDKVGTKVGPIVKLPGNSLPGGSKPPVIKPFPGGIGPIVDAGNGGKPPKKPPILTPFPGGKPPVLDPGNGGKPPKKPPIVTPFPGGKPPILDPFPGGKPPVIDPGNGGGNPPGGGNGHGNGGGNGHGHGHHHHHHHAWWPNYCLDWWCPPYYTQPYCGTVFLNGGWTYVTQPVAVQQISLVQFGEALPEIPSAATFKMQVPGLGGTKGMAAVEVNGVGMQAEVLEWKGDSVVVRLPSVGLTQPLVSQLFILQSDGSMAKNLKFKMLPAMEPAMASTN